MSGRAIIPPLSVKASPNQQTYGMLESRLLAAEDDTRQLLNQLESLGVSPEKPTKDTYSSYGSYTPKKLLNEKNFEEFKNNYESLVSRVCKNESILQSLKLNLVNFQGDVSLSRKHTADFKEKLQLTREAYEQEIGKLTRQVEYLREEVNNESKAKDRAKAEIKELQKVLGDASETRMEAAMAAEELTSSQQKLQKRINDLKEEISREKSLRASLEESHNTLLTRVREMESIVEVERNEVQSMTTDSVALKLETEKLREEVKEESRKKQVAESSYKMLCEEKGKKWSKQETVQMKYESAEGDRQLLLAEMKRLREQYEDLIKQMEQTQAIIDKQQSNNKELVAQNDHLSEVLRVTKEEHERINVRTRKDLDYAKQRSHDKEVIEDEANRLKESVSDLTRENHEVKKKLKKAEEDVAKLRQKISLKDEEFTRTADGLERELEAVRDQMKQSQKERDKTLKDKESLLEEVNQTVDSMVEERALLQKKLQQLQLEVDSHGRARRQLEHENAHLLERVSGFEQQQAAQKHVEKTLKEMMDQKNKLAYENGRLQTQVEQMMVESEGLRKADLECAQYKQLAEALQSKYSQCETEISELKITIERQENQLKQAQNSLSTRHQDYTSVRDTKEELQKENQKLLTQLQSVEEREKRKIKALQKNHEDAKSVNKEIASTLESVMSSHSQLQSVVEGLQIELGKKDSHISRLKNDKNKEQQEWKLEIRRFEERMENLREELRKERDKSQKKTTKDLVEIKKQNDSLSQRNMELMKGNTELRQKMREQEMLVQELKDKTSEQKRKMEYLIRAKKDMEDNVHKMKGMKSDIEDLENLRDTYMAKNREQAEMISTFMGQINSLQTELRQLAQAQSQTNDLITRRDQAFEKEKRLTDSMKKKYMESKKREDEIEQMKSAAEKRLAEVREESLEISSHLNSAHDWFRDKFDNLQKELVNSRRAQQKLVKENTDQKRTLNGERRKAQEAAEKAKAMIRASRQTISRLSDYAELADAETKQQLSQLYGDLRKEKDHSKYLEMTHEQYKDASMRQFENLLHESGDFGDYT